MIKTKVRRNSKKEQQIVETKRAERFRIYEKDFQELAHEITRRKFHAALACLHYSQKMHAVRAERTGNAFRKDNYSPTHSHEVEIALGMLKHIRALEKAGINADKLLAIILTHDGPEDNPDLSKEEMKADLKKHMLELFEKRAKKTVNRVAGEVVEGAFGMSRNHENGIPIKKRDDHRYKANVLKQCVLLLAKLADRLHNIETLIHLPPERQVGYIVETREFLQEAQKAAEKFGRVKPVLHAYINQIDKEINRHLEFVAAMSGRNGDAVVVAFKEAGMIHKPERSRPSRKPLEAKLAA